MAEGILADARKFADRGEPKTVLDLAPMTQIMWAGATEVLREEDLDYLNEAILDLLAEKGVHDVDSPIHTQLDRHDGPGFFGAIFGGVVSVAKAIFGAEEEEEEVKVGSPCPSCESRVGLGRTEEETKKIKDAAGGALFFMILPLVALIHPNVRAVPWMLLVPVVLAAVSLRCYWVYSRVPMTTRTCTGCGEQFGEAGPDELRPAMPPSAMAPPPPERWEPRLPPTGRCQGCGAVIGDARRFCGGAQCVRK
jgi:hypothetical protein